MKFRKLEKIIIRDGWKYENAIGSHYQYKHEIKCGKVTIPIHKGDIPKGVVNFVIKQAQIKGVDIK